jgi:hypothetical protein
MPVAARRLPSPLFATVTHLLITHRFVDLYVVHSTGLVRINRLEETSHELQLLRIHCSCSQQLQEHELGQSH